MLSLGSLETAAWQVTEKHGSKIIANMRKKHIVSCLIFLNIYIMPPLPDDNTIRIKFENAKMSVHPI